jgi:glyoxylase-like metal-dependent hydrolase (beta-lactamase superfamily II)
MLVSRKISLVPALLVLMAACSQKAPPPPTTQAAPEPPPPPAAPAPPPAPNVFKFMIGSMPAYALRDGGLTVPNDSKTLAVNKTPEDVAKLVGAAGLPTDKLSLSINPLVVQAGDKVLLFDTGAGKNMGPGAGNLPADLQEAGIAPDSVTDIFISHSHGDHVGGLVGDDGMLRFPNATIHMSAPEWTSLKGNQQMAALVKVITPKVKTFKPGADVLPKLVKAVDLRGHTPGHSGYLIGSGADSLLYIGDTMHHSVISVQEPDWTIAFDGDAPMAQKNRKDVLQKNAASGQRIYAVHFPFPGLGKFEKQGDKIVWVPES